MKIFFLSSIASDQKLKDTYLNILNMLRTQDNDVLYKHVFESPEKIEKLTSTEREARAKKLYSQMLQCDGLVFEGTHSSTGAGFLLSQALQKNIPTLFLTQENYSGLYLADPNRLLLIKKYDPMDTEGLSKIVNKYLQFAENKRLSNRFNLMISDSLNEYINDKSNKLNISKADYIRNLVYQEMQEDNKTE